jgi:hypothetical protein
MWRLITADGSNNFTQILSSFNAVITSHSFQKSAISLSRYRIISSFLRGEEHQDEYRDGDISDVTAYIHCHRTPFTCPNTDTKHTHVAIYSGEGERAGM